MITDHINIKVDFNSSPLLQYCKRQKNIEPLYKGHNSKFENVAADLVWFSLFMDVRDKGKLPSSPLATT